MQISEIRVKSGSLFNCGPGVTFGKILRSKRGGVCTSDSPIMSARKSSREDTNYTNRHEF